MNMVEQKLLFPALAWAEGVKRISDVSAARGRAAMEVEFVDGVTVTVTRDEISKDQYCIWFPPAKVGLGLFACSPKLNQVDVMAKLNDLAAIAAKQSN